MTNKESIEELRDIYKEIDDVFIFTGDKKIEALDLAINALEENDEMNNQIIDLCKNLAVIADMGEEAEND